MAYESTVPPSGELPKDSEEYKAKVVRAIDQAYQRSEERRRTTLDRIRKNWRFCNGEQDWSHKVEGQSTIFLPDVPVFVEQIGGVIERRLTEFDKWFGVEAPGGHPLLDSESVRGLMRYSMDRLFEPGDGPDSALSIETVFGDAFKIGVVEGEITLKVYAVEDERTSFRLAESTPSSVDLMADPTKATSDAVEKAQYRRIGQVVDRITSRTSRLVVEAIPFEDYFPDMSGARLYTIHEVTQHISELYGNPDFDRDAIDSLAKGAEDATSRIAKDARSGETSLGPDPWMVRVREYWGDLVCPDTGRILERNIFATTCGSVLLRPPTPNPFWHGRRPFVSAPLLRTPKSQHHRALLDRAVDVGEAQNDLYSLMTDDAFSSVWGVRQYWPDLIENADQAAKGIRWGFTATMKSGVPTDAVFLKRVDVGGQLHQFQGAEMMLRRLEGSVKQALLVNDLLVGQLPPRQVKATEVVEASQASDTMFDNIATRMERTIIKPTLELFWLTLLQYLDDFTLPEIVQILGTQRAGIYQSLTPQERFVLIASAVKFSVSGLREGNQRIKRFQRIFTMLNTVLQNPALAQVWDRKFSPMRTVDELVLSSGLDPTRIERRPEENEPALDINLLRSALQKGSQPAAVNAPTAGDVESEFAEPNPLGDQGTTAGSMEVPIA